ncbi:bifunctional TH2 protein, mitochondrial-like isoform X2 [Durio zibethinus]|uniref:Bifunctional TH2 protein, mitochondrial-like isoform X2 n=1 Tax=Durio zibethinus TaxID=66656 RepID=A0A6P5WSH2_DURZI|nr:bifunctional TH2 protein, mitochondrial-like isoform X2 [Durio zibethinus]
MRLLFSPSRYPIKTLFQLARFPLRIYSSPLPPTRRSSNPMAIPPKSAAAVIPIEEGLATRFWNKFRGESALSLYSPFALCLASGSLKIDTFRHYIAQDVHFLKAFAQAYEMAEDCADDDDAKLAISELRKGVLEELKMHNSFVQEWGSDCVKESPVNSATLKYTEFLLATASGKVEGLKAPGKLATPFEKTKIAAYTLGAMTPCMRLYAFLGKEFQALLEPNELNHPYKKWIENYSSESFQASALQTEDLLDKLSVSLTVVDSSAILAEIAIVTAPKSDQIQPDGQIARMSSAELRNTWGLLSRQYTEEYEECIESILPSEKVEFNYEALHKALEQLSDFEKRANSRVIESGVLKGLNLEDIKRAGERLILQDGCISFFRKITKSENINANIHVLSYCWCGDLIRAAFASGGLDVLNVHANEFSFEESVSTGEIVRKVQSPIDKVQAFNDILQDCSNDRKNLTVYIGDSVGDLLCLLKADIGIVIGSSSSLRKVGGQYGVSFVPLFPGLVKKQKEYAEGSPCIWKGQSGILYTASSWDDIHAFILGW